MRNFKWVWLVILAITFAPVVLAQGNGNGGGPGGGGGGEVETPGNNLSLPVIWSEGYALPLRGVPGVPVFNGEAFPTDCETLGVECWYLQQDALNTWQADSLIPAAPLNVNWVDWGDNLEARNWTVSSIVRTEVVLYQDLLTPMTGYTMAHLWGQGPDEMWGTNTVEYESASATVYSRCARFTIQYLTKDPADPTFNATWNPVVGEWEGDAAAADYNSPVWLTAEGKTTAYSAEINVPGKVIYGYNWNVRKTGRGAGTYRLTFSLDGINCPLPINTFFTPETQIVVPVEEVAAAAEETGGGSPVIVPASNLTYIDVVIEPKSSGRRTQ